MQEKNIQASLKLRTEVWIPALIGSLIVLQGCNDVDQSRKPVSNTPKDVYGLPYIIGNLGGKPVNLPSTKVDLVEYDDSPGWDAEKIKNYNPPPRTYASVIESFGFEMRYTDGLVRELYHKAPQYSEQQYQTQKKLTNSPWLYVGVCAAKCYNEKGFNTSFKGILKKSSIQLPQYRYQKVSETIYGLELYAPPRVDKKSSISWRDHPDAEDMYVYKNSQGEVTTIIKCVNRKVKLQTCSQTFNLQPTMKVTVRILFSYNHLADWHEIQEKVIKTIESFVISTQISTTN